MSGFCYNYVEEGNKMNKFIAGLCCGFVIVLGLIHISNMKKNEKALPEE